MPEFRQPLLQNTANRGELPLGIFSLLVRDMRSERMEVVELQHRFLQRGSGFAFERIPPAWVDASVGVRVGVSEFGFADSSQTMNSGDDTRLTIFQ